MGGKYTFGDTDQASVRLRRLAELYETETRELLRHSGVLAPGLAVDLGCGPGWSTRLLQEELQPRRTVGLDASQRYVEEARRRQTSQDLDFEVHDVVQTPFPVSSPDVLFCRFLLTHLSSLRQALEIWAGIAAPGARLLIHETETLETEDPTLRRYYDLVGQMQQHYGQVLLVGAVLNKSIQDGGWRIIESNRRVLQKKASEMAELHVANLRTWRHDEYASRSFDAAEMDSLERSLERIATGFERDGVVINVARQIIAERR
jgi:ubiquinone/menaquinone biosynthesis C-methylase UbiE